MIVNLISFLVLLQAPLLNPLLNQTKTIDLAKQISKEKITISKLDPRDLAALINILNVDQFQRFKR